MEGEDRCRFYRAEWPEEGEVVVARVSSVGASGSYVTLHEYGDKEAMLPHSELSNRRLRSVHGHVRFAQLLCVRVTRVDQVKGACHQGGPGKRCVSPGWTSQKVRVTRVDRSKGACHQGGPVKMCVSPGWTGQKVRVTKVDQSKGAHVFSGLCCLLA